MRSHILQRVATFGYTDIVPAHLAVFQCSSPDGTTPSELAGRAFMTKQAMNYLLGELEERGYLQRLPAEGDGRSRVVVLSRRGHRLVHAMTRAVTEVEVEWERLLGKPRFAQMRGALMDLPVGPPSREGVLMGGLSIGHIHLKVSDRRRRFDR